MVATGEEHPELARLIKYLKELEERVATLEQSIHPDQIAEATVQKLVGHIRKFRGSGPQPTTGGDDHGN